MNFKKSTKELNFLVLLVACLLFSGFIIFYSQKIVILVPNKETSKPETYKISSKVTKVFDGDTIQLENGQKVRYIGIDASELYPNEECYSRQARDANEKLVLGKNIILEKDVSELDKYGRLLRYVYIDNILVNDYLVKNGFAKAANYPPDEKYRPIFKKSEEEAKKILIGLWKSCKK